MNLNLFKYYFKKPFYSWKNKYLRHAVRQEAEAKGALSQTADEVAEYLAETPQAVLQKYRQGNFQENEFFREPARLSTQTVEEYYKKNTTYIYDLPFWNAEENRPKFLRLMMLGRLRQFGCQDILDFGAGAGDLCIELAQNGFKPVYCDLSERLYDFAQWRFKRRGLNIKMFKGWDDLQGKQYDCVVSFDVFEHIKDLPKTVAKLCGHVRPGGLLIFSGAFSGGGAHLAENEIYAEGERMMSLLKSFDMEFVDQFAQYAFYTKRERNTPA
ncbi:MAG: hypothetical protein A2787_00935 [Omnitrophica WOR_2 bacterium RIFCSPHIGHO2_01_FULL_48_9]|nr:MAG: hypothetical protein A3D10_05835 [Omnitrophica WOR_2 bacterium RIFCSPHIGHO2_02_FULL_48_11]OGX31709.1 MAG: hypothetical protein A2787_00935 [Omnitrophica WOR_2 bacterium RIFCSPHIGHO2_01_FULL_48_9]